MVISFIRSLSFLLAIVFSFHVTGHATVLEYGDEDLCNTGTYSTDPKAGATLEGLEPDVLTLASTAFAHSYPFTPTPDDYAGTDQIYVGSTQTGFHDGYSKASSRINGPQVVTLDYSSLVAAGKTIETFTLGIGADDFQEPAFGNPFVVSVNGVVNPVLSQAINDLKQTGPYEQFVSIGIDPSILKDTHILTVTIDEGGDGGDGWAIDYLTVGVTVKINMPVINSDLSVDGQVGVVFAYKITATNNPTSFSAAGLPAGLTVNAATGQITGTPAAAGTFAVLLGATNGDGTGTATLNLVIAPAAPVIDSSLEPPARQGEAFRYQITATNVPTSFSAFELPTGLSIDTVTGLITGTPTVAGTTDVKIGASNAGGTGTAVLHVVVEPAVPVITSALTAPGRQGVAFKYQITATNSPTKYVASGLPSGLGLNTGTGKISGAPNVFGVFRVKISAANAGGTGSATLVLTVQSSVPVITSDLTAMGQVGEDFSYRITASNNPDSFAALGYPDGFVFDPATGILSGVPVVVGDVEVTLSARNTFGAGTAVLSLSIGAAGEVPTVTVVAAGGGVALEGGRKGKVSVRRTGDTSTALMVRYKVKGSAKEAVDYKLVSGTVTIPAGAAQKKIKIKPIDNDTVDGTRKVKLRLLPSPDGSYQVGKPSIARIRIIDND